MRTLLLLLAAASLLAQNPQTAIYPAALATDNDLYVAANRATTLLTSPLTSGGLTINVVGTSLFRVPSILVIGNEYIAVCSKASTSFTVCASGRGYEGSSAVSHISGTTVFNTISARYFNQAAAELKAIETALGVGLANVASQSGPNCTAANISGAGTTVWSTAGPSSTACVAIILTPTAAVTSYTMSGATANASDLLVQWTQGSTGYAVSGLAGSITHSCTVSALANAVTTWLIHYNSAANTYDVIDCTSTDPSPPNYVRSTTGNDTYVGTSTSPAAQLVDGLCITLKADTANTGAASLNLTGLGGSALGVISILTRAGSTPSNGDIPANQPVPLCYNSTGPSWTIQ